MAGRTRWYDIVLALAIGFLLGVLAAHCGLAYTVANQCQRSW